MVLSQQALRRRLFLPTKRWVRDVTEELIFSLGVDFPPSCHIGVTDRHLMIRQHTPGAMEHPVERLQAQ